METVALPEHAATSTTSSATSEAIFWLHKRQFPFPSTSSPPKRHKASLSLPLSPMRSMTSSSRSNPSSRVPMTASSSITLEMLRPYFEEPLAKVAATFGICVTLLKKICRRHGIARWPHRQITGLRKSIASMEHAISYFDGTRRESYARQLLKQKNKLAALLENPTITNPLLATEEEDRYLPNKDQGMLVHGGGGADVAPFTLITRKTNQLQVVEPSIHDFSRMVRPLQSSSRWHLPSRPNYSRQDHLLYLPSRVQQSTTNLQQSTNDMYYPSSSTTFELPSLRPEPRGMLPPISSLVGMKMNSSNTNTYAFSSTMRTASW